MIHFGGPYVNGFIVPAAKDAADALRIAKLSVRARIDMLKGKEISYTDDGILKLKQYMRSLKRPWRNPGEYRKDNGSKAKDIETKWKVVRIEQIMLPVHAGYWIKDILLGKELCNM